MDKEFSRTNKVCYFDLDTSFKQISVKRYKDNSFFFLGYSNNAIGIKPIFLLLEVNSKPLGIADSTALSTYPITSIFPNPATDFISIKNGDVHNLKIYDVKGIEFDCKTQIYTNIIRINISELQTGIYVVRYELNGKIYIEKFVKI